MRFKNTIETFWSKVDIRGQDECWMWLAATDKGGYGKIGFQGKHRRAHQIAFETVHGSIPEGMFVCHSCDTPGCVNPYHLFAGTAADNNADRDRKGRTVKVVGEKHGISKLTNDQVLAIYTDRRNINHVAAEYGVSKSTISEIRNGKRWAHLTWSLHSAGPSNSRPGPSSACST